MDSKAIKCEKCQCSFAVLRSCTVVPPHECKPSVYKDDQELLKACALILKFTTEADIHANTADKIVSAIADVIENL